MTFSEYFNALYPYLSGGETRMDFLDGMIGHFIYEEAQENCEILTGKPDTKRRYIQEKNPNKIKPEYAQYAYSKHNPQRYIKWLNGKMYQQDTYDRIEAWLNGNHIEFNNVCAACDNLLESIFFDIANPNTPADANIELPEKNTEKGVDSSHLSEHDRKLLRDFHIDFDSIMEKFIMNGQDEALLAGDLTTKINGLYNDKWKDRIAGFEDISLQADILGTVATLRELCNALDPDSVPAPGTSVRRLKIKLRNNYVKTHPDDYVTIFPYAAFIDDWNDGEDYEI